MERDPAVSPENVVRTDEVEDESAVRASGPAEAAILAAGIGILVLGILTSLSEGFISVADGLQWSDRVGPLSGKTIIAAASFFGSWAILALAFRRTTFSLRSVTIATAALVVLGLIGTFPTFFEAFAAE